MLTVAATRILAQTFPVEGAKLHYRLAGFNFEGNPLQEYDIEIATGNYTDEATFKANIYATEHVKTNKVQILLKDFGLEYTWRVVSYTNKKATGSMLHHFSVLPLPVGYSPQRYRMTVTNNKIKKSSTYMMLDANTAMYDLAGNLVWYLPELGGDGQTNPAVRDMKVTNAGSITMLYGTKAIEINYAGDVLWKAPDNGEVSGDVVERYHHQFDRLPNGHYMVMGDELIKCTSRKNTDSMPLIEKVGKAPQTQGEHIKMAFTTLIEYDASGKVVWSWKSSKSYTDMKIFNRFPLPAAYLGDLHGNAFYFDIPKKKVYVSFRNISSVFEVDYPSGKVLRIIEGENHGHDRQPDFCGQHSCRISRNGKLYMYNNNNCNKENMPSVVAFKQNNKGELEKSWEFILPKISDSFSINNNSTDRAGGNVLEMPDSRVFISNSTPYNSMLIIDCHNKELLWQGVLEVNAENARGWNTQNSYRASIIYDDADLQKLIWYKRKQQRVQL